MTDLLDRMHPDAECELAFATPYQLLVAVILSAQCTDKRVNLVTKELFDKWSTPEEILTLSQEELERQIKGCGFYHNKAKNILAATEILVKEYGGKVPKDRDVLETLPGVGRKTANVVYAVAFGGDAIAVDTHVHRIARRLGYSSEKEDPVKVEKILEKEFPKELHMRLHHQLIWFGRMICHAKKPDCPQCGLSSFCPYFKKNFSTKGK